MSEVPEVDGAPCFCGVCKYWARDVLIAWDKAKGAE